MQLVRDKVDIFSSGIEDKSSFTIEASIGAFETLSERLYSDKIGAIVRELSTNASDEHRLYGKPNTPFDVFLPTELEPNFTVKDYGRGLSHEDCFSLYTTYFKSTKSGENVSTGCFGLGSKSPFAYTDSFCIVSVHNGIKNNYIAVKDENGPTINRVNSEETTEESGMTIIVPVLEKDFKSFENSCAKVYKWFDVKPNIYPNIHIDKCDLEDVVDNIYYEKYRNSDCLIMGQVKYIIEPHKLQTSDGDEETVKFLDKIKGLVIKAEIGSVNVTPSRESLSYNSKTIKYLTSKINNLVEHFTDQFEKKISSCKSVFEAKKCYDRSKNPLKDKSIKFNGKSLYGDKVEIFIYDHVNRMFDNRIEKLFYDLDISSLYINDLPKNLQTKKNMSIFYNNGVRAIFKGTKAELRDAAGCCDTDELTIRKLSSLVTDLVKSATIKCQKYDYEISEFVESKMSLKHENAVYVLNTRDKYMIGNKYYKSYQIVSMIKQIWDKYDDQYDIYTIKPSMVKNVDKRKNWISLDSLFAKELEEFHKENEAEIAIANTSTRFDFHRDKVFINNKDLSEVTPEEIKNGITGVIDEHKRLSDKINSNKSNIEFTGKERFFSNINRILGKELSGFSQNVIDFCGKTAKIIEDRYPLYRFFRGSPDSLVQYVKQVEELISLKEKNNEVCN